MFPFSPPFFESLARGRKLLDLRRNTSAYVYVREGDRVLGCPRASGPAIHCEVVRRLSFRYFHTAVLSRRDRVEDFGSERLTWLVRDPGLDRRSLAVAIERFFAALHGDGFNSTYCERLGAPGSIVLFELRLLPLDVPPPAYLLLLAPCAEMRQTFPSLSPDPLRCDVLRSVIACGAACVRQLLAIGGRGTPWPVFSCVLLHVHAFVLLVLQLLTVVGALLMNNCL